MEHTPFARWLTLIGLVAGLTSASLADEPSPSDTTRGDRMLAAYFKAETGKLRDESLAGLRTIDDWNRRKDEQRRQLFEMLGLDPLPARTDLKATITGTLDHADFTVEKLHFQSRPGLYVTGNLFVPKKRQGPVPAILYVCGHARVAKDGVPLGAKAHYQHHGAWFARNGYVCLVIDTLQLGEIEGIHHGTYDRNRWWWLSRGYTPAGVEAWNCIRALDYLETRPEVDGSRIGVTGRSGGGAYSWWISALDDRIRATVPVAGITDLQNHVVDGAVEGHCDCMYLVNTYRWDYPQVAALNFPRPLLVSNTDRDAIFPLDGVYRTYSKVRALYELEGLGGKVALNITAGGHNDTQELQVHAMRWFDQHLRKEPRLIENAASKLFEPEALRVFERLPADEINTKIDESFVAAAAAPVPPSSEDAWKVSRDGWMKALREKTFRGWPDESQPLELTEAFAVEKEGLTFRAYDFTSQPGVRLRLYLVHRSGLEKPDLVVLNPVDQAGWNEFLATVRPAFEKELEGETLPPVDAAGAESLRKMLKSFPWAMAYVAPRGVGPTRWNPNERKHVQNRRRFYLLGQTWEGMQTWDIRRAMQAVRSVEEVKTSPLWLQAKGNLSVLAAYASLFEPPVKRLDLHDLPLSHQGEGPALLNVLRFLDVPQALAMCAERSQTVVYRDGAAGLEFLVGTAKALGWPAKQVQIRQPPKEK
ncbi:MAG: acetylxylan esterase [Planctomycetaceae bacterium]|nr:acetylxylan esterase [Planctomycetaceae bacterium]